MEIRGKHDEHRDKSEPVTKFFIKNNMRFHFYKFAFIGVEKTGIKAYRCVAPVDSDWRLLAVMRRGS